MESSAQGTKGLSVISATLNRYRGAKIPRQVGKKYFRHALSVLSLNQL